MTTSSARRRRHDRQRGQRGQQERQQQQRQLRRYLQISQSHTANPNTLAGYLLKQSKTDPHVWKRVYCVLTEDYLWYVHRCASADSSNHNTNNIINSSNTSFDAGGTLRMASKRGRICLARALLLEPPSGGEEPNNTVGPPPPSVPHSLAVVDGGGETHVFRAPSGGGLARQWRAALAARVTEAAETAALLRGAELIVTDETVARNVRWTSVAVEPLLRGWMPPALAGGSGAQLGQRHDGSGGDRQTGDSGGDGGAGASTAPTTAAAAAPPQRGRLAGRTPPPGLLWNAKDGRMAAVASAPSSSSSAFATQVLRFGMAVAEYREGCRHIQAMLWSELGGRTTAVVTSGGATTASAAQRPSSSSNGNGRANNNSGATPTSLLPSTAATSTSSLTRQLVQDTWEEASDLLAQATQVAMQVHVGGGTGAACPLNDHRAGNITNIQRSSSAGSSSAGSSNNSSSITKQHLSRSLETLCRHIDYVITGQFSRSLNRAGRGGASTVGGGGTGSSNNNNLNNNNPTTRHNHNHHHDPPPMDLFDLLLAELQSVAREQMMCCHGCT